MSGRDTDAPSTAAEAGVVGDPYNDIVARAVPSSRRSRLLAVRFFGSGILALIVAFAAHEILNRLEFQPGYAAILLLGAVGLAISATFSCLPENRSHRCRRSPLRAF